MRTLSIDINNEIVNGVINYTNVMGDNYAHYQVNVRNGRKDFRGDIPSFEKLERKVKRFMDNMPIGYFNSLHYMWNEINGQIDLNVTEKNSGMSFNIVIQDDAKVEFRQIVREMDMDISLNKADHISEYAESFEGVDPNHQYTWRVYGKPEELMEWLDEMGHFSNWIKVLI